MQQSRQPSTREVITPFEWRRYDAPGTQRVVPPARRRHAAAAAEKPPISAAQRAERILAQRWGNPYCKPGRA